MTEILVNVNPEYFIWGSFPSNPASLFGNNVKWLEQTPWKADKTFADLFGVSPVEYNLL